MKRLAGLVTLLLAHGAAVAAQSPVTRAYGLVANRFGLLLLAEYDGTLEWSATAGRDHYSASATLQNGVLQCSATSTSEEGTFHASGPGLIEITLGEDPDEENPPARPGGKMYIIRAACPNPRSPPPHEARWSDEYSTYKRQGGEFDVTKNAAGQYVWRLPDQLQGNWTVQDPEEQRTMNWRLCRRGFACPGSP